MNKILINVNILPGLWHLFASLVYKRVCVCFVCLFVLVFNISVFISGLINDIFQADELLKLVSVLDINQQVAP